MIREQDLETEWPQSAESHRPRRYLSMGLEISGRPCVVVGGGEVGTRKALILAEYDATVTVIAPQITQLLHAALVAGEMDWIVSPFEEAALEGAFLVVAATGNRELDRDVTAAARSLGALVCNTSDAADSDLIFTAHFQADEAIISIHTHGRNPRLTRHLRDAIDNFLKENR
jgi:siroheme synthase-like protein